ncbi:MAG: YncE family protein [Bacteroidetes bacterium]|nr:YncE family protein [Bacteroidota bacterium]
MKTIFLFLFIFSIANLAQTDALIVLNKDEASTWIINPKTSDVLAKINVGNGPHEGAVSPDGKIAVVCNYGANRIGGDRLSVISIINRKLIKTIDISPYTWPHGINFLEDGKHVLVTSESKGKLLKINIESAEIVTVFDIEMDLHMVELSSNDKFAFTTSIRHGKLTRVDLKNSEIISVNTGRDTEAIGVHPTKDEVWVGNNQENQISIVNAETMIVIGNVECGLQPIRLTFTVDGKYVLVSNILSGDLAVIDSEKREVVKRISLGGFVLREEDWKGKTDEELQPYVQEIENEGARPIGVIVGPDNKFAYVANNGLDHIAVIDLSIWEIVKRIPTGKGPDGMAFSRIRE